MEVIKPNDGIPRFTNFPVVFLGGSIEMGAAENWQERVEKFLSDRPGTILNPRRDDWDSSWPQDPTSGTEFHAQVCWELQSQDHADIIVYWFDKNTKSPITLLELGAYSESGKCLVYCPKEFWRYGNVKILCDWRNVCFFDDESVFFRYLDEMTR